jgi:hypothetical protein
MPNLKPHKVYLHSYSGGKQKEQEEIFLKNTHHYGANHKGDADILKADAEDVTLQVRAGTRADAVIELDAHGDKGKDNSEDISFRLNKRDHRSLPMCRFFRISFP